MARRWALFLAALVASLVLLKPAHAAAAPTPDPLPDDALEEAAAMRDVDVCTIARIDASAFTTERFFGEFYQRAPFILVNYTRNSPHFRRLAHIDELLRVYGHEDILAASANTYSHTRIPMTFAEYVALVRRGPLTLRNESEATAYLFGDHDDPGQWASDEELAEAIRLDQEASACCNRSSASVDANGLPISDECTTTRSTINTPLSADPLKRPIWAKLLRQYHPPPYVIPSPPAARDISIAESQSTDADQLLENGVVRVKLAASTFDSHRLLFEQGLDAAAPSVPSALPPRFDYARYSFGVGGHRSGVPFHFHGAAIGEVLHGTKRWWLFKPNPRSSSSSFSDDGPNSGGSSSLPFPSFRPELTQLQWLTHVYPTIPPAERPLQCTLHPEELLYVPGMWHHATLNLGPLSVFLSSFIDEGRMEAVMKQSGMDLEAMQRAHP